ncbi:hypothetical protein [Cystobacter fuscus]|uniref:hypothetical protein n=1 Tax=Cystobacter fuscus TaxID=43 RepID=UPI002B2F964B|nr:hypothetical protein F0U63_08345 [Cystobacter fuscus]
MSLLLRLHWGVWGLLCLLLAVGTWANHVASRTEIVPVVLEPGQSLAIPVYRFKPGWIQLSLKFDKGPAGGERPEFGSWHSLRRAGQQGAGQQDVLVFDEPGAPIVLRVESGGHSEVFEALPDGTGHNGWRDLVPYVDDGDPARFRWRQGGPPRIIAAGHSTLQVTVLEVGASVRGEHAELLLRPPLGFKNLDPGYSLYSLLWFFFFWPFLAGLLVLHGLALLLWTQWQHRRRRRRQA